MASITFILEVEPTIIAISTSIEFLLCQKLQKSSHQILNKPVSQIHFTNTETKAKGGWVKSFVVNIVWQQNSNSKMLLFKGTDPKTFLYKVISCNVEIILSLKFWKRPDFFCTNFCPLNMLCFSFINPRVVKCIETSISTAGGKIPKCEVGTWHSDPNCIIWHHVLHSLSIKLLQAFRRQNKALEKRFYLDKLLKTADQNAVKHMVLNLDFPDWIYNLDAKLCHF